MTLGLVGRDRLAQLRRHRHADHEQGPVAVEGAERAGARGGLRERAAEVAQPGA